MVWSYDCTEKSNLQPIPSHNLYSLVIVIQAVIQATSLHLPCLQNPAIMWSQFMSFPGNFWQAKSMEMLPKEITNCNHVMPFLTTMVIYLRTVAKKVI